MSKAVIEGFQAFLSKIQPLHSEHEMAVKHKDSIKSCVANNFKCYDMFDTGSFGNETAVRHYSDTDYFAPIPAGKSSSNSTLVLRKLKEALQYTFPRTSGIEVNNPAVLIPFGQYASETIEVTPCNFNGMSLTPYGNYPRYQISDGNGDWMYSSPQAHNKYVTTIDEKLRGKLKPLIKFIKAWKFMHDVPIISFYIELRVTKFLESNIILSYDEAISNILNELDRLQLADMRDPMGISGLIPSCKTMAQKTTALSKLSTALSRAEKAYDARTKGNLDNAFYYWNLFFNGQFPRQ